jgi:hypothetical protein
VHLEQVLLLSLNVYISLQNITYTYSTQSGQNKYINILLLGEGKVARRG